MSALTTALTGPRWVVVHQHRRALWTVLGLLALSCGTLAVLRLMFTSGLAASDPYAGPYDELLIALDYGSTAVMLAPLLIAVYVAGPLVAREMETGAYRVAWTQSVTPLRWLTTKLTLTTAVVPAGVTVFVAVFRWSRTPVSGSAFLPLWSNQIYAAYGTTAVAYALLAVAVGTLTGLLVHRALAAMSIAGLVTGTVMLTLGTLRYSLWPTEIITGRPLEHPRDAWWVATGNLDTAGERVSSVHCPGYRDPCWTGEDGVTDFAEIHPSTHFWPIQLVETGIVLALTAAAAFAAFRVLRRLHA
ncbi:ABC transporter permease [Streptomyces sp. NPDC054841]